jgi:hypothetical protein
MLGGEMEKRMREIPHFLFQGGDSKHIRASRQNWAKKRELKCWCFRQQTHPRFKAKLGQKRWAEILVFSMTPPWNKKWGNPFSPLGGFSVI